VSAPSFPGLRTLLGVGALAASAPVLAGSSITPTAVELTSARSIGQVTLWNGGNEPMLVQARAVSWRQADGKDVHAEAPEVMIAPAIVEVPARSGQIFRLRLRAQFPASEQAYRLRLEDITPPKPGCGIGMRIQHDLPLVVGPQGGKAVLTVTPCPRSGPACLRVANTGTHLGKITSLELVGAGWTLSAPLSGTVLAGAWREWPLKLPSGAAGQVTARLETSAGPITGTWRVGP